MKSTPSTHQFATVTSHGDFYNGQTLPVERYANGRATLTTDSGSLTYGPLQFTPAAATPEAMATALDATGFYIGGLTDEQTAHYYRLIFAPTI